MRVLQVKEFILILLFLKIVELVISILFPDVFVVALDSKVLIVALSGRL